MYPEYACMCKRESVTLYYDTSSVYGKRDFRVHNNYTMCNVIACRTVVTLRVVGDFSFVFLFFLLVGIVFAFISYRYHIVIIRFRQRIMILTT